MLSIEAVSFLYDCDKLRIDFSLRYLGQQVATLRMGTKGEVFNNILSKTAIPNADLGGINFVG
jgi:hypothetical protein